MQDSRKNIKVVPAVKMELQTILNEIAPKKTESFILAYLTAMYSDQKAKKISLADHQSYMQVAEEMNR